MYNNNIREFNQQRTVENTELQRGQVWYADLGEGKGSQQGGIRPVILTANMKCLSFCTVYQCVTVTSQNKKWIPTHVDIEAKESNGLTKDSIALCETNTSIRKDQLLYMVGKVDLKTMSKINKALAIQQDIKEEIDSDIVERMISNIEELYRFTLRIKQDDSRKLMIHQVKNSIETLDSYCKKFGKRVGDYLDIKINESNISIKKVA